MPSRRIFLSMTCLVLVICTAPVRAEFVGDLQLIPKGCEKKGKCRLKTDFGYVDPDGVGWQAKKGIETDGASIPQWAQPMVGAAFEKDYIKAAVIHDYYCAKKVRSWQATHRAFYNALVDSGVSKEKAQVMYAAVFMGGPRWKETQPGTLCPIGKMCVSSKKLKRPPAGLFAEELEDGKSLVVVRNEIYESPDFKVRFEALAKDIEAKGGMAPAEIEARVRESEAGQLFHAPGVFVPK